jgi:hypothetical protein
MRTAVLMLACRDYEATELALACHMAYLPEGVHFFILQNCRGTYDAERTLSVARRYEQLFPRTVTAVEDIQPDTPYRSISSLLASERFKGVDFVCKVDDDAFPLSAGWLDTLLETYRSAESESSREPAYVTPLINNNTWGFAEVLGILGLREAYLRDAAMEHRIGSGDTMNPFRILSKEEIFTGANGTVWAYPHIARWLHTNTTLQPDRFLSATKSLTPCDVPSKDRYSIGCILFRKSLWPLIDDGGIDDEHMMHQYCRRKRLRIVCARSVPFVHLAYFSQREENRDLVEVARTVYEQRLGLPFPIAMRQSRLLEIESRLRFLENQGQIGGPSASGSPSKLTPEEFGVRATKGVFRAALRRLRLGR